MEVVKLEEQNVWESIEQIYRNHNHKVLEDDLSELSGEDFELIYINEHTCTYESDKGNLVILNKYGDINYSSIDLNPIFERMSQNRLGKTNHMMSKFNLTQ